MLKRTILAALALLALLLSAGCTAEPAEPEVGPWVFPDYDTIGERRARSMASYADGAYEVEDLCTNSWYTDILFVEFLTPGSYDIREFGSIVTDSDGNDFDFRSWGAETQVRVLEVMKGDASLRGCTVTAGEELLRTGTGQTPDSRYFSVPALRYAILCTHHTDDYDAYVCNAPEWTIIPVADDDTIAIWPYLQHADEYPTLASFRTMVQEQLRQMEARNEVQAAAQPQSEALDAQRIAALQAMLNEPENNGILGSEYELFPEMDLDRALISAPLWTETADPEALSAFAAATGTQAESLLTIPGAALDEYLQEKFAADYTVFSQFTWVYLEEMDAWFHTPYSAPQLEITVTGGTIFDVQNTIHYTFRQDGALRHGTVVYNDFGNLSYFESNVYR